MAESAIAESDYMGSDFEELDEYPIVEGYSYIRILFDKKHFKRIYYAVEPALTPQEKSALDRIMDILQRSFSLRADQLDDDNITEYLSKEVRKIANEYNIRIGKRKIRGEGEDLIIMSPDLVRDIFKIPQTIQSGLHHERGGMRNGQT